MPRDTKTRYQGVFARHKTGCAKSADRTAACTCRPSYYGVAYDRGRGRQVKTSMFPAVDPARNARSDMVRSLEQGVRPAPARGLKLRDAREQFIQSAREGVALNKQGKRYKPKTIANYEECLRVHVEPFGRPRLGDRRITDITRGDIQVEVIDNLGHLSPSRVRAVITAIRALYNWADMRELAIHSPGRNVQLPARGKPAQKRIVTPVEFAQLLAPLELEDQAALALAGFGWARLAQIQRVRWEQVDFSAGTVELGVEWLAAKYEASHRKVPMLPPLRAILTEYWLSRGRPATGLLFEPKQQRRKNATGVMSGMAWAQRAHIRWRQNNLLGVTLSEARHAGSTWLEAAGVSQRIQSYLMGHEIPRLHADAAAVTMLVYTHVLEDDVRGAVDKMTAYIVLHQKIAADARI